MKYLINILKNQSVKYKQLYESVEKQKNLLIVETTAEFAHHTHKIEILMNDIRILERNKQNWLNDNACKIEDLVSANSEIASLYDEVLLLANKVKRINECNRLLLKNKMEFITFNINVLTQTTGNSSYQSGGDLPAGNYKKIKMFDQSI
ncbi:flagellar protein FlgN [Pectinatus brassicae]|uniref:Flagellar biosynthesis/type III secretory pathway chaperone n=1 Tax=Pectinatus brassicae TaxID=862415 RepID=A0A840UVH2_9FIRM|nr:flagellar protein FlgN [Pectinatus brassicae]MBB5336824.1 flagellar biosynthesis/type III secretory pathway chaperone [Pectinatus brassicae]